jgi:hypothetical protein
MPKNKRKGHSLESLQKSHKLKKATEGQLDEAISDEDIRGCIDEAFIHDGDLSLDGDLALFNGGVLIVTGNLAVSGNIATDETGTLIVGKNLTGRHLYLEGNLEVHGDATLRGVVYGFYEAGMSFVHGVTKAKIGLFGNHSWEPGEEEDYKIHANFANFRECKFKRGNAEALRKELGDRGFTDVARMLGLSEEEPPDGNAAWGLKPFENVAR